MRGAAGSDRVQGIARAVRTLNAAAREALLRVARVTIDELAAGGRIPPGAPHLEAVRRPAGALVRLGPSEGASAGVGIPLWRAVQTAAARAIEGHPNGYAGADDALVVTAVIPEGVVRRASPPAGAAVIVVGPTLVVVPAGRSTFDQRATLATRRAGLADDAWRGIPAWTCRLVVLRERG